jgi:DNA-binding PadR family transcriptional regulator
MTLEYGILGFLSHKDLNGYEIKKAFDISCAFIWAANQGQIYRTLEAMLHKGWVSITEIAPGLRHDKKTYRITDAGRAALKEWLTDGLTESPMRNEALLKLFHMAKADPEQALRSVDRLIAQKKQITAIFDKMTVTLAAEYREVLGVSEDSLDYRINLFLSKWGYMREQVFLSFLEQYRDELARLGKE